MTTSEQAIAAAREILRIHPDFSFDSRVEQAAIYIQKHYAAKDAEIETLETKARSHELELNDGHEFRRSIVQERDQLKTRVAEISDELACPETLDVDDPIERAAIVMCKIHKLTARVAELEKNANSWWEVLEMIPEGTAGTTDGEKVKSRLQELERKAKALDWLERTDVQMYIFGTFIQGGSNHELLSAIESAMEKQK